VQGCQAKEININRQNNPAATMAMMPSGPGSDLGRNLELQEDVSQRVVFFLKPAFLTGKIAS
jgi:hypothetical protein